MTITPISGADVALFYRQVEASGLDAGAPSAFLGRWRELTATMAETDDRLRLEAYRGEPAQGWERYRAFLEDTLPVRLRGEQRLGERLLAYARDPAALPPLIRFQMDTYREENLPLVLEERLLQIHYLRVLASQGADWRGHTVPLSIVEAAYEEPERRTRERAWRLAAERRLQDASRLDEMWGRLLHIRAFMAENAGLPNYPSFRRLDDGSGFHLAVEEFVSPPLVWLHEARKERLGLRRLRPWDLHVDGEGSAPGPVFLDADQMALVASELVGHVDSVLAARVERAAAEGLLDLEGRVGKAPGGHLAILHGGNALMILLDGAGRSSDLWRLLNQAGRAGARLVGGSGEPWPLEQGPAGVAAAGVILQLLCAPYLADLLDEREAARAEASLLERCLLRWTADAMLDAFERWAYANPTVAADPERCDGQWRDLWLRFLPAVDWTGLEHGLRADRQRRQALFTAPCSSLARGLEQLRAVQLAARVWEGELLPVEAWRSTLAAGPVAWDEHTLREAVLAMEARM